jgi:ADP-dependent NAD(P)H-hydrate dehydratase / NAD(P)H-hydrate epimerase
MSLPRPLSQAAAPVPSLPLDDPFLRSAELTLDALAEHWAPYAARRPMTAEQMRGADARAQRLGVPGAELMEQAGYAVAVAARAALRTYQRSPSALVLVLAGPGNNGGDGFVAARHLAQAGVRCVVALVAGSDTPQTPDARLNWDRLDGLHDVERMHSASHHDVAILASGIERAALVIDALLGTGVHGPLREPIRTAVDICLRARRSGVPVLSVDTPTAVDLSSGLPSDPVVAASATVTFHRPKEGLLTRWGGRLAGRVLVAPIGIPSAADPT